MNHGWQSVSTDAVVAMIVVVVQRNGVVVVM